MAQPPFLLERARTEGTPLLDGRLTRDGAPFVSRRGEHQLTFVWHGNTVPALSGDFNFWAADTGASNPLAIRLEQVEPNVWAYTMTVPRGAYIEYVFLRGKRRVNDPYNARRSPNGIGGINNFLYIPPGHPNPLLKPLRTVPHGRLSTHTLVPGPIIYGSQRKIHLYHPPTAKPAALLIVLDGQDYLRRAKLPTLLDNLFADQKIPPIAAAMVESTPAVKGSARMSEYAANEATLIFLLKWVLPLAVEYLNLVDIKKSPGAYGMLGASMGGLMSFFTAARAPQIFGHVISQAGAFELQDLSTSAFALAAQAEPKPRVWMDVGEMDFLLRANRRMFKTLKRLDYDVKYREYAAYHNWVAWRNSLPDALTWTFGNDK